MRELEGVTPPEVADLIKDVIENKSVCDVGCGEGTFLDSLGKYAYRTSGIEEEKEWAFKAAEKGHEVLWGSSWFQPLPEADVYYLWTRDAMGIYLKAREEGTKGTFVFGHTVRKSLHDFLKTLDGEYRYLDNTDWWVFITELK